ncbi:MAG: hypothetical protein ACI8WB_001786 [Phenylobacterium sp.]|jgi:hypothetical protein
MEILSVIVLFGVIGTFLYILNDAMKMGGLPHGNKQAHQPIKSPTDEDSNQ